MSNETTQQRRYFLVAYSWQSQTRSGNGNIWFSMDRHPSNSWIKRNAAAGSEFNADGVVITCITEMSKPDFEAFTLD